MQPPKGRPNLSLPARSGLSAPDCSLADKCLDSNTILYLYSTPSSTSSSKDTARQQMCSPRALSTRGLAATPWSRTLTSATRSPVSAILPRPALRDQHAATSTPQLARRNPIGAICSARLLGTSTRHVCSVHLSSARHVCVARLMGELLAKICLPHICYPRPLATSARHICSRRSLLLLLTLPLAVALAATRADRDRPTRRPADTEG